MIHIHYIYSIQVILFIILLTLITRFLLCFQAVKMHLYYVSIPEIRVEMWWTTYILLHAVRSNATTIGLKKKTLLPIYKENKQIPGSTSASLSNKLYWFHVSIGRNEACKIIHTPLSYKKNHKIISQHSIHRIKYFAHSILHPHQYTSTVGLCNRVSSS